VATGFFRRFTLLQLLLHTFSRVPLKTGAEMRAAVLVTWPKLECVGKFQ